MPQCMDCKREVTDCLCYASEVKQIAEINHLAETTPAYSNSHQYFTSKDKLFASVPVYFDGKWSVLEVLVSDRQGDRPDLHIRINDLTVVHDQVCPGMFYKPFAARVEAGKCPEMFYKSFAAREEAAKIRLP